MSTSKPSIRIVRVGEELEGLYVDGVLRGEAKSIQIDDVLAAIGLDAVGILVACPEWFGAVGYLPCLISDVKLHHINCKG